MATLDDAFVQVAPDVAGGKRIRNFALQLYVDNNDGNGPQLQTVFVQAVAAFVVDVNGNPLDQDDTAHDQEWKRQLLDEMRAIRLGIELMLETGPPSFDPSKFSLVDEARAMRLGDERLEQES